MRQLLRTLSLALVAFTVLIVAALFLLPSDLLNAPVQSAQTTTTSTTSPPTTMSHAEAQALVDRVAAGSDEWVMTIPPAEVEAMVERAEASMRWQNREVLFDLHEDSLVVERDDRPPVIVPAIGPAPTSGAVRFGLTLALLFTLSILADRARSDRVPDEPEPEP